MGRVFALQLIRKRMEGIEIFARTFPPRFFDNYSKKREGLEKFGNWSSQREDSMIQRGKFSSPQELIYRIAHSFAR